MKKSVIVFLSLFLFISAPFLAHANIVTATGKYLINAIKHVPGAVRVDATNTATGAKHVIKHGVSSADLGKGIGAGIVGMAVGSGVGLAFQAITGLALDAVDWVMSDDNTSVKFKVKGSAQLGADTVCTHTYWGDKMTAGSFCASQGQVFSSITMHGQVMCGTSTYGALTCPKPDAVVEKTVALSQIAQKVLDLADGGNAAAQKSVEDYVTHIAQRGDLDAELDNSPDITKPDPEPDPDKPMTCPPGTVKIGDTCIKKPEPDTDDTAQCGDCCDELIAILIATAELNAKFYEKSFDNDAQSLAALNQINAQLTKLSADFNLLLNEAKLTNQTLTQINDGQDLHFTELKQKVDELKQAVETGNADILAKLSAVDASIQQTNAKLDKLNENLEKMQKCEGTEFNKKICEFIDWVQSEPSESEESKVDIKDVEAENSNKIDMAGECPAPYELSFNVLGYEQNHSISYEPLCGALVLLKPIFVGSGALSGMFILMGYSRASNTGVNG